MPVSAAHGTALPVGALRIDPFDDAVHVEGVAADTQEVTGGYRAKGKERWEEGTHTGSTHQECKSLPSGCVHVRGYAIPALSPDNGAVIARHLAIGTTPVEWKPMKGRGGWSVPHGKSMAKCRYVVQVRDYSHAWHPRTGTQTHAARLAVARRSGRAPADAARVVLRVPRPRRNRMPLLDLHLHRGSRSRPLIADAVGGRGAARCLSPSHQEMVVKFNHVFFLSGCAC